MELIHVYAEDGEFIATLATDLTEAEIMDRCAAPAKLGDVLDTLPGPWTEYADPSEGRSCFDRAHHYSIHEATDATN